MNREILFRGKRKDNGEWIYGSLGIDDRTGKGGYYIYRPSEYPTLIDVIPETVGQFSGLMDKNGKRAFESDRIKCDDGEGIIVHQSGCFMIEWTDDKEANMDLLGILYKTKRYRTFEIAGSIHDHPELLK